MGNQFYPQSHPLAKVDVAHVIDRLYDAGEKENIKWIACGCIPFDQWRLDNCLRIAYPDVKQPENGRSLAMKLLAVTDEEEFERFMESFFSDVKDHTATVLSRIQQPQSETKVRKTTG